MRVRHVVQIERIRGRNAGDDADLLDAEEHEGSPEDVEQLHGDEQHPERNRRLGSLGREADAVVADEHGWELAQGTYADNWTSKAADCSAAFLRDGIITQARLKGSNLTSTGADRSC